MGNGIILSRHQCYNILNNVMKYKNEYFEYVHYDVDCRYSIF